MTEKRKTIAILGSGRCGTSMIANSIRLLGVNLGKEFIVPDETNPKGFWENQNIVDIHKKIIMALGNQNTPYPRGWWNKAEIAAVKQDLKCYLEKEFGDSPLWGWKDPRTCQCIGLWKEVLKELDVEPYYLIVVRNPKDVVNSFQKAYKHTSGKWALERWIFLTLMALKETKDERRYIVDYDQFLANGFRTIKQLSSDFDIPISQKESTLKKQIQGIIEPNLQHQNSSMESLLTDKEINDTARRLYLTCYKACYSTEYFHSDEFKSQIENYFCSWFNERR
ncbi:sulfotransferase family protein [Pseudalkalibacillus caeni]|uniref:Sulfotransferase family protein n=1 Tax=Exobacillus caeni TaxID=2574798 RepID=A0A5R9F1F8_9BACL|nr:hypothetical protein [Pseudalkalibacillus caeni]TLS37472.1 hypothetical protein FCL54_10015 [Pseudalkalibacillus caeni]